MKPPNKDDPIRITSCVTVSVDFIDLADTSGVARGQFQEAESYAASVLLTPVAFLLEHEQSSPMAWSSVSIRSIMKKSSVVAAAAVCVAGCGGKMDGGDLTDDAPGSAIIHEGELRIVEADISSGKLIATFRQNDREITYDCVWVLPWRCPLQKARGQCLAG